MTSMALPTRLAAFADGRLAPAMREAFARDGFPEDFVPASACEQLIAHAKPRVLGRK